MRIHVDRTSVAMGDDAYPHDETVEMPESSTIGEVVAYLRQRKYLAQIAGGRATWILEVDGEPAAVVAQEWAEPRFLVDSSDPISSFGDEVSLLFKYWAQRDPGEVFDALAAGEKPAR
jgi:hypothetical protein